MAASADLVGLTGIQAQRYDAQNNRYIWPDFWFAYEWTDFSSPDDPGPPDTNYVGHFKIPNRDATLPWKIKGECVLPAGTWTVKVRIGENLANSVEYTPTVQNGEFEIGPLIGLGENNATWAWFTAHVHTPINLKGLKVNNCMRIRTMA